MTALHDTEVDGVRCFWVDTGRPTLAAQLLFRRGIAEELLPETGWLHLLEHLALHGRGGGALHVNGSVSLLLTSLDAHGPAEQVAAHFASVTSWLADPEFSELERERNVLRAEADTRGGVVARALGWRYGAVGPGVSAYAEPGLARATASALADRAREVFTRGNAVLVLDGPPPPSLSLELYEGPLQPPAPAVPCEAAFPAAYVEGAGVVVSGVVSRTPAATFVPDLLQRELRRRLRDTEGAAYAPWSVYEAVDDDRSVVIAGSDLLPEMRARIADLLFSVVRDLARNGPDTGVLAELLEQRVQMLHDPYAAFGLAARAGHAVLNGRRPESFEEVRQQLATTDPGELAHHLEEIRSSLLLGLPQEAENTVLRTIEFAAEPARARGRVYRNVNWPADRGELVVGDDRVEARNGATGRGVDLGDVVGMFTFEDGGRHLVRTDGYGITVEPTVWRNGGTAAAALDELVPPHLHLPSPARDVPPVQRVSAARRTWARLQPRISAVVVGVLCLAFAIATTTTEGPEGGLFWLVTGVVATAVLELRLRRTQRNDRQG